jgi:glycosyltransferase involved in cell wall biosynthesis
MITLMDPWVFDPTVINTYQQQGLRAAFWLPVDCEPLGVLDARILAETGIRPIAMSQHGKKMLANYSPLYVPHAVDTTLFAPAGGPRSGEFVIGINAANQDPVRKAFGEQLQAFRLLANDHDDVRMVLSTRKTSRQGSRLEFLVANLDLAGKVEFTDQYLTVAGMYPASDMALWYSQIDLLSAVSYGEGFGLPSLEAQSCGVPVVLTDCSASAEMCGSGWLAGGQPYWNAGHSAWWKAPSIREIHAAYEQAYEQARDPEVRARARAFALGYDIAVVAPQYWGPALEELQP